MMKKILKNKNVIQRAIKCLEYACIVRSLKPARKWLSIEY